MLWVQRGQLVFEVFPEPKAQGELAAGLAHQEIKVTLVLRVSLAGMGSLDTQAPLENLG